MGLLKEAKARNYLKKVAAACRVARGRKRNRRAKKCAGVQKTASWLSEVRNSANTGRLPGETGPSPEQLELYYQQHPELRPTFDGEGGFTPETPFPSDGGGLQEMQFHGEQRPISFRRPRIGTPKTASWLSEWMRNIFTLPSNGEFGPLSKEEQWELYYQKHPEQRPSAKPVSAPHTPAPAPAPAPVRVSTPAPARSFKIPNSFKLNGELSPLSKEEQWEQYWKEHPGSELGRSR